MSKIYYILVIFIMVFVGLTFSYMNNQIVEVKYLFFTKQIHLSLLLLITLIVGVVLGYLAHLSSTMKIRRNLSSVRKELKSLESVGR